MAGVGHLFESAVPLTVAQVARHDMRADEAVIVHRRDISPFEVRTCVAPEPRQSYIGTMNLDLTDEEHAALLRLVKRAMDEDRFSYAPRLDPLKAI
jgi:hypothetical protein